MTLRQKLQGGYYRNWSFVAFFSVAFLVVWFGWTTSRSELFLSGGPKIAFVAAAFSVTAYNLRTRVIDLILKATGSPEVISELCRIGRNCGARLTNMVIFFTICACLLGGISILPKDEWFSRWLAALAFGSFAGSFVLFGYIVFAFDRVERYVMDEAEKAARIADAKRLLAEA